MSNLWWLCLVSVVVLEKSAQKAPTSPSSILATYPLSMGLPRSQYHAYRQYVVDSRDWQALSLTLADIPNNLHLEGYFGPRAPRKAYLSGTLG